jgi:hypothetical protein
VIGIMADRESFHDDSISGLLRGIVADVRTLMREEIALARTEMREQASRAKVAAISFAVAGVSLVLGMVFLLTAAATGIAEWAEWPVWAGFLVVAVVLWAAGLAAMMTGKKQMSQVSAVPPETVSTLKENAEWIAKRLSSARR